MSSPNGTSISENAGAMGVELCEINDCYGHVIIVRDVECRHYLIRLVPYRDGLGHEHTRRSIVETMRDKEEAHNDDALEPAYGALAYAGGLGIVQRNPSPIFPLDLNPTTVAVRHIAHEVLRTFDPDMAPVFSRLGGARIEPIALIEFSERKP